MIFSEAERTVSGMPLLHQTADDSSGVSFPCGDSAHWVDRTFILEKLWGFGLSLLISQLPRMNCIRMHTRQQGETAQADRGTHQLLLFPSMDIFQAERSLESGEL